MIFLKRRTPAGVIDDDVEKNARSERMRCKSEFAKLIHAGRAFVKLDERGINGGQIKRGVWTAERPAARVSCGRRVNWEQMQNAAAQLLDDVWQLFGEAAQSSRRWNDG